MGAAKAGIKDVAQRAGVSISTVSNVLNHTKKVSDELRKRVLRAVEELQYAPSPIAQGLKSGRTHTFGMIIPQINSPFFPQIVQSAQLTARQYGFMLNILSTQRDTECEKEYVRMLCARGIDGIILASSLDLDVPEDQAFANSLPYLESNGNHIPVICLETIVADGLDGVTIDNCTAIRETTRHVIELGRKHIAYIAAPLQYSMGRSRMEGFLQAVRESGLPSSSALIKEGDYSPLSGYYSMKQLLYEKHEIDALVCGNDQMAVGAMRAILEAGLRIPEDIAVTGCNNISAVTLTEPSLTTYHVPREALGKSAVELLIRRIEAPDCARKVVCHDGCLIVRRSTSHSTAPCWDLDW